MVPIHCGHMLDMVGAKNNIICSLAYPWFQQIMRLAYKSSSNVVKQACYKKHQVSHLTISSPLTNFRKYLSFIQQGLGCIYEVLYHISLGTNF